MATSPAAAGNSPAAVKEPLYRQVDVISNAAPRDLDPIGEGREGPVGPAAPAVLGYVLVQRVGEEALAVHVAPVPLLREVLLFDVPLSN